MKFKITRCFCCLPDVKAAPKGTNLPFSTLLCYGFNLRSATGASDFVYLLKDIFPYKMASDCKHLKSILFAFFFVIMSLFCYLSHLWLTFLISFALKIYHCIDLLYLVCVNSIGYANVRQANSCHKGLPFPTENFYIYI